MEHSSESILAKMDSTLDQLIQNAKMMQSISLTSLQTHEIEALQKTQESLLANLIHMDKLLDGEQKKKLTETNLKDKVVQYHLLNQQMTKRMMGTFGAQAPAKVRTRRAPKAKIS